MQITNANSRWCQNFQITAAVMSLCRGQQHYYSLQTRTTILYIKTPSALLGFSLQLVQQLIHAVAHYRLAVASALSQQLRLLLALLLSLDHPCLVRLNACPPHLPCLCLSILQSCTRSICSLGILTSSVIPFTLADISIGLYYASMS